MSEDMSDGKTVLGLIAARTARPKKDMLPDFLKPAHPFSLYHQFPRIESGQFPKFDIRGTAATKLSSMSYASLTSSMYTYVQSAETVPLWSSVIAESGKAITNRPLDSKKLLARHRSEPEILRIAKKLLLNLVRREASVRSVQNSDAVSGLGAESITSPLNVREILDQAWRPESDGGKPIETSTFGEEVRFNRQFAGVTIIVVQSLHASDRKDEFETPIAPEAAFSSEDVLLEFIDRFDEEGDHQVGVAVALRSRHVTGHLEDSANEARKLRTELHVLADFLSAHLFVLQSLQTIRDKMLEYLDDVVGVNGGDERVDDRGRQSDTQASGDRNRAAAQTMIARDTAIQRIWKLRTDSLREMENRWHLNDPPIGGQPILRLLEERLGLTAAWERERSEVHRIAEVADYLGNHQPRILVGRMPDNPSKKPTDELHPWLSAQAPRSRIEKSRGRLVELHPFRNRDMIMATVGSRITTSALLTATAGLLLGLLLSNPDNLESPIDSLLLLVSTIAFFFETLILSHGARMLQFTTKAVALRSERASGVALFLGQYAFAIALPMAMTRLMASGGLSAGGRFLSYVVSVLALVTMVIYFEIIEAGSFKLMSLPAIRDGSGGSEGAIRRYGKFGARGDRVVVGVLHLMAIIVLFSVLLGLPEWLRWSAVSLLLVLLAVMAAMSWLVSGYEGYFYYEVDEWDCMGEEERSFVEGPNWRGSL